MSSQTSEDNPLPKELYALSARSEPAPDGVVELILSVRIQRLQGDPVPLRILLEPGIAAQLCPALRTNAEIAERWLQNLD